MTLYPNIILLTFVVLLFVMMIITLRIVHSFMKDVRDVVGIMNDQDRRLMKLIQILDDEIARIDEQLEIVDLVRVEDGDELPPILSL